MDLFPRCPISNVWGMVRPIVERLSDAPEFRLQLTSMPRSPSLLRRGSRRGFSAELLREFRTLGAALVVVSALVSVFLWAPPLESQDADHLPQISHQISHRVRSGGFVSAVGPRAALLGKEDGRFEAWVYPLKIVRDLRVRFHIDGRVVEGASVARNVITRPESSTIVYSEGAFQVRETLFVPIHEPGATIIFEVHTERPLAIEVAFQADFELEWPAVLGAASLDWNPDRRAFLLRAHQGQDQNQDQSKDRNYAAWIGSPTASDAQSRAKSANQADSSSGESSFFLGTTPRGTDKKLVVIAASLDGPPDAAAIYDRLVRDTDKLAREAETYYADYLRHTLNIKVPDEEIQQAYDWARINMLQARVDNPVVGSGLIAGYGPSGTQRPGFVESQRPGFDWFFGRDALWTTLALDSEGDFSEARTALELLAKYQRADGKIPHEISQSAGLVDWFGEYPYGYAAADATPLFLIAASDYVEHSGDVSFARERWDSIERAYQFLNSTVDGDGFAENAGVGHGWVESGPLVPVRTEIYQAALGIEALRAMGSLARTVGKTEIGKTETGKTENLTEFEQAFERERGRLNERFWSPEKKIFAFAIGPNNDRVDEATVLPAVPMWFGLLDPPKAEETIARLAAPDMQADWGMRILSSSSAEYSSDGYHYGSVWPLFTGWASVAEYRYHRELAGYLNLRANALLALGGSDGSGGHVTEVLAGDYNEPLETSTPQQIWSAAMIASPLVRGLFGLEANAVTGEIVFAPHVPADWQAFTIGDLQVGTTSLELRYQKDANEIQLEVTRTGSGKCTLNFSPAVSLRTNVKSITLNGRAIPYHLETSDADQHVSVRFEVPEGKSALRMRIDDDFEIGVESQLPPPGSASAGVRVVSESWTPDLDRLSLDLAGLPGNSYEFDLSNAGQIVSTEGAEIDRADPRKQKLLVRFPAGQEGYAERQITLQFRPKPLAKSRAKK
jgi:glycogen debranching enzyme